MAQGSFLLSVAPAAPILGDARAVTRRFIVIGQKATAGDDFRLEDLAGTSGRLDVLVRCIRPALLSSHGLRRYVVVYLVLLGGPRAPRIVRIEGIGVRFLRPDERNLAVLMKKVLATRGDETGPEFVVARPGICIARGGLDVALADAQKDPGGASSVFVLREGATDLRRAYDPLAHSPCFVIGDHLGIPADAQAHLDAIGARPLSIGPVSVHADDVIAILTNELDRADAARFG